MNQTFGLISVLIRAARWGLPWLFVLTISAGAAYAMTVALGPASDKSDVPSTQGACVATAPMVYVGLNSWIHDPGYPVETCQDDAP